MAAPQLRQFTGTLSPGSGIRDPGCRIPDATRIPRPATRIPQPEYDSLSVEGSMNDLILPAALALTLWTQAAAPAPQAQGRQPKQYTIDQFLNTVSINDASFSSDESRILFSSNRTGVWNAYTIP